MLSNLPPSFSTPIIVAQHISIGFDHLLVNQLNKSLALKAKVCDNHEQIKNNCIYFVPAGKITEIVSNEFIVIDPPQNYIGHLPSISSLFASIASCYECKNIAAVIMTGMGADGTAELKILRNKGAVTIAQDKESSVVYGMPKAAVEKHAALYVKSPSEIVDFIINFDRK